MAPDTGQLPPRPGNRLLWSLAAMAIAAAAILLAAGLVMPAIEVRGPQGPGFKLLKLLGPRWSMPDRTLSVLGGIRDLLARGQWFLGVVILVFSVLFPIAKLVTMAACLLLTGRRPELRVRMLHVSERLARFSMLDVLVLAFVILAFTNYQQFDVRLREGVILFAVSILLSMIIPSLIVRACRSPSR